MFLEGRFIGAVGGWAYLSLVMGGPLGLYLCGTVCVCVYLCVCVCARARVCEFCLVLTCREMYNFIFSFFFLYKLSAYFHFVIIV